MMKKFLYFILPCLLMAGCSQRAADNHIKKIASIEVEYLNDSSRNHSCTFIYDKENRLKELNEEYADGEKTCKKISYTDSSASYRVNLKTMLIKGEYKWDENKRVKEATEKDIMDTAIVKGTNEYAYEDGKLVAITIQNGVNDDWKTMLVLDAKWKDNDLTSLTSGWYKHDDLDYEEKHFKVDIHRNYDSTLTNHTIFDMNYLIEQEIQSEGHVIYPPLIAATYGQKTEHLMTRLEQRMLCQEDSTKNRRTCYHMKYQPNNQGDIETVNIFNGTGEKAMVMKIKYR